MGLGDQGNKSREQNSDGRSSRTEIWVGFLSLLPALSSLCFWDHWKAIYPCVARLIFFLGGFRFSHMLLWYLLFLSI